MTCNLGCCNLGCMTKRQGPKWTDVPLEIATPAVVVLSARMSSRDALGRVSEELAALGRDRCALVARRDELVDELRAQGATWVEIAAASGVSRQALMKRA